MGGLGGGAEDEDSLSGSREERLPMGMADVSLEAGFVDTSVMTQA